MPLTKPSFNSMLNRAWNKVSQATGLTASSESAFGMNILRVFCNELMLLWDELEYIDNQTSLSSAIGSNLDSIGAFFGLARKTATSATTAGTPNSVAFTNNGATSLNVPAGTRVWPSSQPNLSFLTSLTITIPAGQVGYVDVTAVAPGSYYNVGAGVLDSSSMGSLVTVTNPLPISNGSDVESDNDFRVRIQNQIYLRESANTTAITTALTQIPGVSSVQVNNLARGTGTVDVLIYGYDPVVSQSILSQCQAVLNSTVAAGISAIAKAPDIVYVDVAVQVSLRPGGNLANVTTIISSIVQGYINSLPIENGSGNGTLSYSVLQSRIQFASADISGATVSLTVNNLPALMSDQTLPIGSRFVARTITVS